MKTDRELLELAAKALGISGQYVSDFNGDYYYQGNTQGIRFDTADGRTIVWNPLEDDGDALRLAVKISIDVAFYIDGGGAVEARTFGRLDDAIESYDDSSDPVQATRRAIVRAAAAIGEAMP